MIENLCRSFDTILMEIARRYKNIYLKRKLNLRGKVRIRTVKIRNKSALSQHEYGQLELGRETRGERSVWHEHLTSDPREMLLLSSFSFPDCPFCLLFLFCFLFVIVRDDPGSCYCHFSHFKTILSLRKI